MTDYGNTPPPPPGDGGSTPPPPPGGGGYGGATPPPPPSGGGYDGGAYGAPPPAGGYGAAAGPPPGNNLILAIVSLLCCWPIGIPAVVFAAQVNGKWNAGDQAGAVAAADKAKKFAIAALVLGIIATVFLVATGALSGNA